MLMTVTGPCDQKNVEGNLLIHEHVLVDARRRYRNELTTAQQPLLSLETLELARRKPGQVAGVARLDSIDDAVSELALFKKAGGSLILDCTTPSEGRDPAGLRKASLLSGVKILMGASASSALLSEANTTTAPTTDRSNQGSLSSSSSSSSTLPAVSSLLAERVCLGLIKELRAGVEVPALHDASSTQGGTLLASSGTVCAGFILVEVTGCAAGCGDVGGDGTVQKRDLHQSSSSSSSASSSASLYSALPCSQLLSASDLAQLEGAVKAQKKMATGGAGGRGGCMIMVVLRRPFTSASTAAVSANQAAVLVGAVTSFLSHHQADLSKVVISGVDALLCDQAPTTSPSSPTAGPPVSSLRLVSHQQQLGVSFVCSGFGLGLLLCPDLNDDDDDDDEANSSNSSSSYDEHGRPLPLHDDELARGVVSTMVSAATTTATAASASAIGSAVVGPGSSSPPQPLPTGSLFLGQGTHLKLQLRKYGGFGYAHSVNPKGPVAKRLRRYHQRMLVVGQDEEEGAAELLSLCLTNRPALTKLGWWAQPATKEVTKRVLEKKTSTH
jgi:hypothetical protein